MANDRSLRFSCAGIALVLAVAAYALQGAVDPRAQAFCGIVCFILLVAAFSTNLRAVNVRTLTWGIGLQFLLALFILKFEIFGVRPGYEFFSAIARMVRRFLEFTAAGSTFVFGDLAKQEVLGKVLPERLRLRLQSPAADFLRLGLFHRPLSLWRPAVSCVLAGG